MTNNFNPGKTGAAKPRLSKEEYAEKKRAEKEAIYQMADDTAKEIIDNPDKFMAYLNTQSMMDRYSAVNALLIYNQFPEASQLKEFNDWRKDEIQVKKGSKSISILEPVEYAKRDGTTGISYNVKRVFDILQTNEKKHQVLSVNRDPEELITAMIASSPVEVEVTNELPYPNKTASYNNEKQVLFIKKDIEDGATVIQCLAKELGHAQLSLNSNRYNRSDNDFAATCIGYMLCKKYGVDKQNLLINCIPEALKNAESKQIRSELAKIRNAMNEVHSRISEEMNKKKQEHFKNYER